MSVLRRLVLASLASFALASSLAQPVPGVPPAPVPILSITGQIADPAGVRLTLDDLRRLPQRSFTTTSPWSDRAHTYSGPLLRDVLAHVGAQGTKLRARALNDYHVIIPVQDAREHDVIVALAIDDKPIPVRARGPLFVIYPFAENPALQATRYYQRSIWQLASIQVE